MGKIIAIGGGEIGRPGHPIETLKIDKETIRLCDKKNPRLLFVPTASGDAEEYVETVKKYFGERLGCNVDVLYLVDPKKRPSKKGIKDKILNTDIIYVGGGNTLRMMNLWRKLGVDLLLKKAYKKGIVLSGLSAGSICWFESGNSDARKSVSKDGFTIIKVRGLGLIPALHCPHYDIETEFKESLKIMMKKNKGVAIALDNCCALEIVDDKYRIMSSKKGSKAYRVYWEKGVFYEKIIKEKKEYVAMKNLIQKI